MGKWEDTYSFTLLMAPASIVFRVSCPSVETLMRLSFFPRLPSLRNFHAFIRVTQFLGAAFQSFLYQYFFKQILLLSIVYISYSTYHCTVHSGWFVFLTMVISSGLNHALRLNLQCNSQFHFHNLPTSRLSICTHADTNLLFQILCHVD